MDLLGGYASSSSSSSSDDRGAGAAAAPPPESPRPPPPAPIVRRTDRRALNAAPKPRSVMTTALGVRPSTAGAGAPPPPGTKGGGRLLLAKNPTKSILFAPVQGPSAESDPSLPKPQSRGDVGAAEANVSYDELAFDEERKRFQRTGIARGPDGRGEAVSRGERGHRRKRHGATVDTEAAATENAAGSSKRRKRKTTVDSDESSSSDEGPLVHGSDDEAIHGIWAPPSKSERDFDSDRLTDVARGVELTEAQLAERAHVAERDRRRGDVVEGGGGGENREAQNFDRLVERKMSHLLPPRMEGETPVAIEPTTKFHGDAEYDYAGRSWIAPPPGSKSAEFGDVDDHRCFVPKKVVHRFAGHNRGVHRIRLFPDTGHLLLSGGLDGKCKVWSIPDRRVMRTYVGHSAAVRDVRFNNDGSKFLSCSFDRFLRLWNTETGEVLGTYTNRRVPYVVQFYPHDDNVFVVGCSDNKIVAYDSTTKEIVQEYDHHLAPVNTITFVEDRGTKMITSSDDKKVLVWEWDIGVPVKYISDPTMHSVPVVTLHPGLQYWVGQSLDNQIVVYGAKDRFALNRKKKFTGHQVAGYACDIAISPDGQFVVSGDGDGRVYFWDWRRHKLLQKYRGHDDGPSIGCAWHPVEPSTVFTCGWDGIIKMWQ